MKEKEKNNMIFSMCIPLGSFVSVAGHLLLNIKIEKVKDNFILT